jgi:hypothetical protein
MASMAPVPISVVAPVTRAVPFKSGVDRCRVRDRLIFAFLLSVNRLNEDNSRVEFARTAEFREEARLVLEQSRRKCNKLHDLIVMHCLNHKC